MPSIRSKTYAARRAACGFVALHLFAGPAVAEPLARWRESDPFEAGRPAIRRFEDTDGLPQNTVHALLVGHDGRLWAGTQDGAATYDGSTWTTVDLPLSGRSNFVRSMLQAANGDLWIGSQAGGLLRRRGSDWTVFVPGDSGLPDDRVNALLETSRPDGGTDLWIGTHEAGLTRFDGQDWTVYTTAAGLPSQQVWDLITVGEGAAATLWIATGAGPATLPLAGGQISIPAGAPRSSVSALLESRGADGTSVIRVGTYGDGLWSYDGRSWSRAGLEEGLPSLFVTDLAPGPSQTGSAFWIATDGGGVALHRDGSIRGVDLGATLSSRAAYRILETTSEEGARAVWVGTRNNGVLRLVDGYWRDFQPFPETPKVPVNAVLLRSEENGQASLWLGTDGYGLAVRRDGAWTKLGTASGAIGNDTVMTIAETRAVGPGRRVWVGTRNGGLSLYDGKGWRIYRARPDGLPGDMVQALAEQIDTDGRGRLWVGTRTGLAAFDGTTWLPAAAGGPNDSTSILALRSETPPGGPAELWVGTTEGLWRLRGGEWSRWGVRDGLANPSVQSLHIETSPSGQRTVWIGTDGGGAFLLDPDRADALPKPLASRGYPALPNGSVYAILEDADRRIYVLTNRGVTRLTRTTGGTRAESFTTEHGLPLNQGNRGAGLVDYAGRIWIGTVGGAAAYDPRLETDDRVAKRLLLSAAPVDCDECAIFDGQRLQHEQRGIRFRYQLLSFFGEALTTYRTELAGHEMTPGEWSSANLREVSALPQGDYLFRVWGRDARGNVSGPAELAFTILPAPWETSWARLAAAALVFALGFLLFRARNIAHARREHELEAQVASRTRSLQRANALLVELSYVDALTAVPNRRRFDELFDQEWKRSARTESPLGLVILDIDGFKHYNDRFGHQQGDEGLRHIATALADALPRSGDAIARYGGEEFAVLLPATDGGGAGKVADLLRERVEALAIPHAPESGRRYLTVSCGAVSAVAAPDGDAAELFRRADEAMYRAKRAGGNRTESG